MKRLISLLLILFGTTVVNANAADSEDAQSEGSAIETALDDCAASVAADSNGQPDAQAMDSCMSEKGYSRPTGRAHPGQSDGRESGSGEQGGHPPPPPQR